MAGLPYQICELLGSKIGTENENVPNDVAEQLSRINEQLAIKNRRSHRISKVIAIIAIILAAIFLISIFIIMALSVPNLNTSIHNNQPIVSDETIMIDE